MSIDWIGLAEGIRNRLVPPTKLKEVIEATRDSRLAICNECEWKRGNKCGKCGCNLVNKASCLSCNCPILKWIQVITRDDDQTVKETLNGNNS